MNTKRIILVCNGEGKGQGLTESGVSQIRKVCEKLDKLHFDNEKLEIRSDDVIPSVFSAISISNALKKNYGRTNSFKGPEDRLNILTTFVTGSQYDDAIWVITPESFEFYWNSMDRIPGGMEVTSLMNHASVKNGDVWIFTIEPGFVIGSILIQN